MDLTLRADFFGFKNGSCKAKVGRLLMSVLQRKSS